MFDLFVFFFHKMTTLRLKRPQLKKFSVESQIQNYHRRDWNQRLPFNVHTSDCENIKNRLRYTLILISMEMTKKYLGFVITVRAIGVHSYSNRQYNCVEHHFSSIPLLQSRHNCIVQTTAMVVNIRPIVTALSLFVI